MCGEIHDESHSKPRPYANVWVDFVVLTGVKRARMGARYFQWMTAVNHYAKSRAAPSRLSDSLQNSSHGEIVVEGDKHSGGDGPIL